jgi:hypothetical protein
MSCVPGQRSRSATCEGGQSRWADSNRQPTDYKSVALPLSYIGGLTLEAYYARLRLSTANRRLPQADYARRAAGLPCRAQRKVTLAPLDG